MTVYTSGVVNFNQVKVRWEEPYVSSALNKKTFGSLPRGIYGGFVVIAGPGGRDIQIVNNTNFGIVTGYASGCYDTTSGYSLAIFENIDGHQTTINARDDLGRWTLNLTGLDGQSVYSVLDVDYAISQQTSAAVKIVDAAEIDSKPWLLVLSKINVPVNPLTPISGSDIITEDPIYPRTRPFATRFKNGFMSFNHERTLKRVGEYIGSMVTGGGKVDWDLGSKTLTWSGDLAVRMLSRGWDYSIAAQAVTLEDQDVIYAVLSDESGGASNILAVQRGSWVFDELDASHFPLFYRDGDKVFFPYGDMAIEPGEVIVIGDSLTQYQDRNSEIVDGGEWNWTSGTGELTFTEDAFIQVPGLTNARNTIQVVTNSPIILDADDKVAYVTITRKAGLAAVYLSVSVAAIENVPFGENIFIIAARDRDEVLVGKGNFRLADGETKTIGDGVSHELLYDYIGAKGHADNNPMYSTVSGVSGPNNYVVDGDSLTKSVKRIDNALGGGAGIARQNLNLKLINGGTWSWTSGTGELSLSDHAYIEIPDLINDVNRINVASSPIVLDADGKLAYVEINRSGSTPADLSVTVAPVGSVVMSDNTVVIARREGNDVIIGAHSFRLINQQSQKLDSALSDQALVFFGAKNEADTQPDYENAGGSLVANRYLANGVNLVSGVKQMDTRAGIQTDIERQDRTLKLIGGGDWSWTSGTGDLGFNADAFVQIPGIANGRNRIPVSGSPISMPSNGAVAYVDFNREVGIASDLTVNVVDVASYTQSENRLVIARRFNDYVQVGSPGGFILIDGQSGQGGGASSQTVDYIGAASAADSDPDYTNALGVPVLNYQLIDGDNLTKGLKRLDINAHDLFDAIDYTQQLLISASGFAAFTDAKNINTKLIDGGIWSWSSGTGSLSFTDDAYLQTPDFMNDANKIAISSSPIVLPADNYVAWIEENTSANTPHNLHVYVTDIELVPLASGVIIIARRNHDDVHIGSGTRLINGQSTELDAQMSIQNRALIGSGLKTNTSSPGYSARGSSQRNIDNSQPILEALSSLDAELDKFFGQLRLTPDQTFAYKANLSSVDLTMKDGSIISQAISSYLAKFGGASINFLTGDILTPLAGPLGVNFVPASIPSNQYCWYSIKMIPGGLDADGRMNSVLTVTPASALGTTPSNAPYASFGSSGNKIGQILIFNNAGNIQVYTIRNLFAFGGGGGSGGSGQGLTNNIANPNAEDSTDGWRTYKDTAPVTLFSDAGDLGSNPFEANYLGTDGPLNAQSFTLATLQGISGASVGLKRDGVTDLAGNLKMTVYVNNSGTLGTLMATSFDMPASNLTTSYKMHYFRFPAGISLSAGNYWLAVEISTGYVAPTVGAPKTYVKINPGGGSLPGSFAYRTGGGSFNVLPSYDMICELYQGYVITGTGGSPAYVSLTRTNSVSEIMEGSYSFKMVKASGNAIGEGVSTDFTIDLADTMTNAGLGRDFYAVVESVLYDTAGTAKTKPPRLYLIDLTNGYKIEPEDTAFAPSDLAPLHFRTRFMLARTHRSYRLCIHVDDIDTSAWSLVFDRVRVGSQYALEVSSSFTQKAYGSLFFQDQTTFKKITSSVGAFNFDETLASGTNYINTPCRHDNAYFGQYGAPFKLAGNFAAATDSQVLAYNSVSGAYVPSDIAVQDRNMRLIGGGDWGLSSGQAASFPYSGAGYFSAGCPNSNYRSGQTFTTPADGYTSISSIQASVSNGGSAETNAVYIDVYKVNPVDGKPTTVIGTSNAIAKNALPSSYTIMATFTFPTTILLAPNTKYAWALRVVGAYTNSLQAIQEDPGSFVGGGYVESSNAGVSWSAPPTSDFNKFAVNLAAATAFAWSADAYVQIPGISDARNTILAGGVSLAAGEVAYVVPNKTAGGATNLTVSTAAIASATDPKLYVIGRRTSDRMIVPHLVEESTLDNAKLVGGGNWNVNVAETAVTLFDNTANGSSGTSGITSLARYYGTTFVVGSTAPLLKSIIAYYYRDGSNTDVVLQGEIWSINILDNKPGTLIAASSNTYAAINFALNSPTPQEWLFDNLSLSANTRYYFIVRLVSGTNFGSYATECEVAPANATEWHVYSSDSGATWTTPSHGSCAMMTVKAVTGVSYTSLFNNLVGGSDSNSGWANLLRYYASTFYNSSTSKKLFSVKGVYHKDTSGTNDSIIGLELWSFNTVNNKPGSFIASSTNTMDGNALPVSPSTQYTFYFPGVTLAANTRYYVIARVLSGVNFSAYVDEVEVAGADATEWHTYSSDGGATWTAVSHSGVARMQVLTKALIPTLTWDAAAYVAIPGLQDGRNTIAAGSSPLDNGEVLYVNLTRTSGSDAVLTPVRAAASSLDISNAKAYVLAKGFTDRVVIGDSQTLILNESSQLYSHLGEIDAFRMMEISTAIQDTLNIQGNQLQTTATNTSAPSRGGPRFVAQVSGQLLAFKYLLKRVGSPLGNLYARLYATSGGNPTTIIATSSPVDISSISASAYQECVFNFTGVSLVAGTTYVLAVTTELLTYEVAFTNTLSYGEHGNMTSIENAVYYYGSSWDVSAPAESSAIILIIVPGSGQTIKFMAGSLGLSDGRELYSASDISCSLSALSYLTDYYAYIDLTTLSSLPTTVNGRSVYTVSSSNITFLTMTPEASNKGRYVPLGFVRNVNGIWTSQSQVPVRKHDVMLGTDSTPEAFKDWTTVGTVGTAGQIAAGHTVARGSFPDALTTASLSFFNLSANSNDGYGSRNLTNVGTTPFTGVDILGASNSCPVLNGSGQYFNSTNTFFDPGDVDFCMGGWFNAANWIPGGAQTLFGQWVAAVLSFRVKLNADGTLSVSGTTNGSTEQTAVVTSITLSGWNHIALRYTASTNKFELFVNGVNEGSLTLSGNLYTAGASRDFRIGVTASNTEYYAGRVNQFFVMIATVIDADIGKTFASKFSHNRLLTPETQKWEVWSKYGSIVSPLIDVIVDEDMNDLYFDLFKESAVSQVAMKLFNGGTVGSAKAAKPRTLRMTTDALDALLPISHGLGAVPEITFKIKNVNNDFEYALAGSYFVANETQIKIAGSSLVSSIGTGVTVELNYSSGVVAQYVPSKFWNVYAAASNIALSVSDRVLANTSAAAFTGALPASPNPGDEIQILDARGTFGTYAFTLSRNGKLINGVDSDLDLDVSGKMYRAVFIDDTYGWAVYS